MLAFYIFSDISFNFKFSFFSIGSFSVSVSNNLTAISVCYSSSDMGLEMNTADIVEFGLKEK